MSPGISPVVLSPLLSSWPALDLKSKAPQRNNARSASAMAATAAMMHGGYQSVNNAARIHQVQHSQQLQRSEQIHHTDHQPAQAGEPEISTFFCRALYDYRSNDSSSLSFYRGDIIEVLTQLESGWWDGLLNDERGWFPSNYVSPISDSEAEAELGPLEYSMRQTETEVHDSAIDVGQIQRNHSSNTDRDHGWIQEDAEYSNSRDAFEDLVQVPTRVQGAPNDFWLPQVDGSGQVFCIITCFDTRELNNVRFTT